MERTHRGREGDDRFGVRLQRAVSDRLTRLGIAHERYENGDSIAREERVELLVETGRTRVPLVKIQYTLRDQTRPKIFEFIQAALLCDDVSTPRVYLEIRATRQIQIKDLAERVAYAIRQIVRAIRDLPREIGNALGLVLDATRKNWRDSLFPLPLLDMLGVHARAAILTIAEAVEKARKAAKALKRAESIFTWPMRQLRASLGDRIAGFAPHPEPAYATVQSRHPLRMPFRR